MKEVCGGEATVLEDWIRWSFDKYSDGKPTLSRHGARLAMISLTGKKPRLPDSRSFDYQSFRNLVGKLQFADVFKNVADLYSDFDPESKGFVTCDDLSRVSKANSADIPPERLSDAFNRIDADHDGRIPYSEFVQALKSGLYDLA